MSRRRSVSPKALYHPITQSSVAVSPVIPEPDIELDDEDEEGHALHTSISSLLEHGPDRGQGFPDHDVHPDIHEVEGKIRWTYFVLGNAVLLPWNALITATPYFLSRLAKSSLRSTFSSYLSMSFTASNFIFLAHATATSKQTSPSRQIIFTLFSISILTLLLTLSTFVRVAPALFFAFVLVNGVAQAALGSYLQTSVIAVASLFGPSAVQAMVSGQGAVAVLINAVQLISTLAAVWGGSASPNGGEEDDRAAANSAFIFFGVSTVFLWASAMAQRWLASTPAYMEVARSLEKGGKIEHSVETGRLLSPSPVMGHSRDASSSSVLGKGRVLQVAKVNFVYEIAVAYVFVVTMAVFPPITISVRPVNPSIHPLVFSSVHFLMFGVGDFLGRYILSFPSLIIWSSYKLIFLSALRTLFIPLFLICNVTRPLTDAPVIAPIISSDFLFMFIILIFGFSNGYTSSACIMSASSLEHNPKLGGRRDDVDIAATLASFFLVGGLAVGSIASFSVRASICQCNPFSQ